MEERELIEKQIKSLKKVILHLEEVLKMIDKEDEFTCGGLEQTTLENIEVPTKSQRKNKNKQINDFFEEVWKLIPSTQYDCKTAVSMEIKKKLFDEGLEKIKVACESYLRHQNPDYRYKRDRFFKDIIWNYLENVTMIEDIHNTKNNFNFKGF